MLWKSPLYKFRIAVDGQKVKELVVDVTTSAPSFSHPGKTLKKVFTRVFDYLKYEKDEKINRVLDFGAGKLRNTIYFLEKEYYVTAVEFEKLSKESKQAQEMFARAKQFKPHFKELVFPHEFIHSNAKFDIILLINVVNIMPVPAERLLVLQHCYQKLRSGGFIFWYTQYGDDDYKRRCTEANRLGDGFYIGDSRRLKSFYREFSSREIDEMITSSGFIFEKSFPVPHNDARLYRKHETNLLQNIVTSQTVTRELGLDKKVETPQEVKPRVAKKRRNEKLIEPNPEVLSTEYFFILKLKKVKKGAGKRAREYQELVKAIFARVFDKSLRNIRLEETMFDGRKRIDVVATNIATSGFFEGLSSKSQIKCKYIPIECKNYTHDVGNPEFDQIGGRLYSKFGMVGFLVYRDVGDKRRVLKRCQDHLEKDEYILALDDADLIQLLELRMEGKDREIDDYLDNKFRALVTKKEKE